MHTLRKKSFLLCLLILCTFCLCSCKNKEVSSDTQTELTDTSSLDNNAVDTGLSDSDMPDTNAADSEVSDGDMSDTNIADTEVISADTPFRFVDALGEWHETTIRSDVVKHNYNWEYLRNDGLEVTYGDSSQYTIRKGIDVSYHQGKIDWEKVRAAGYDFAIIRIGYRGYGASGVLKLDTQFHANIKGAQAAGLDVGVYFFSQAINEEEAIEEAELVLNALKGYELQLPVVYDPELIRDDDARTDDVSGEQFTKNTIVFCNKIEEAGFTPMIYSNMFWEAFLFDMGQLQKYPIWYADYEKVPQTPYAFTMWQYSEKGSVDGIDGVVDLNVWFCPVES